MNAGIERNIPLFYVIRALALPFFWLPILYFYLTQVKGLSIIQTTFLLGLQEFLLIFLEVPTGVIADKVSRKFSVTLGYIITSLPFALLPLVNNYIYIIGLFAIKAVGKALVSGADTALLYDSLLDMGRTSEYKKIKTVAGVWTMGIATVAIFLGGWLGQANLYSITLWLPLPFQLIGAFAAYLMIEPEISKKAKAIQEQNYLRHVWSAAKIVLVQKNVLLFALIFAILEGTAVNMKWYYPAIFDQLKYGLLVSGIAMAGLYGGKTLINWVGTKLILKDPYKNTKLWILVIASAWLAIATIFQTIVVLPSLILILLGLELATNSVEELIHESLESKVRATAMSFVNLLSSIGATLLILYWGYLTGLGGASIAIWGQVGIFGLLTGAMLWYKNYDEAEE
jgi:MFS family permease